MSVLAVQRPHQMPGVIVLPRHNSSSSPSTPRNRLAQPQRHHTPNPSQVAPAQVAVLSTTAKPSRRQRGQLHQPPASSSPHRSTPNKSDKRRSHQNVQQAASDNSLPSSNSSPSSVSIISGNSSSSATVSASHSPVLSSASPVTNQAIPATTTNNTTTPPRKGGRQQHPSTKSAPNTPTPANSLPVPANRRRARSPRPTQKLPGLNFDEIEDEFSPAKKNNGNNKKAKVPATVPEPATWQQAALLKQSHPSGVLTTGSLAPLVDPITAVASYNNTSHSNPPSPTRITPPKGSVFAIANEHGLSHSSTMPNLSTPNRRTGGMHARAPSVPSYSTFPPAKPISSLDALFSGLTVDSAPVTPGPKAGKAHQHTRGQSVSSSLPPSTSLHARMAAAAAATPPSASRRERTLTGNNAGYIKFAGASFQAAPDAMMLPRPAFGGMLARRGSSHGESSDEDEQDSSADERAVSLSEEEETGVFAF